MARSGVPVSLVALAIFPAMTVAGAVMTAILLAHVKPAKKSIPHTD